MPLVHENSVGAVTFSLPWTYLASGAAAAALVYLSKKLTGRSPHQNGAPLPPGPPATWFWENPMPKQKYVCSSTHPDYTQGPSQKHQLDPFFAFLVLHTGSPRGLSSTDLSSHFDAVAT